MAFTVARDVGATSINDLPPSSNTDQAWNALESSGLIDLRIDGGGIFDLVVVAEVFGMHLSAAPFIGAVLARELVGPTVERVVASLDGRVAIEALGATEFVAVRNGSLFFSDSAEPAEPARSSQIQRNIVAQRLLGFSRS